MDLLKILTDGLIVTVVGMGVTFAVLIFISFVIYCFKYINKLESKKTNELSEAKVQRIPEPDIITDVENNSDDLELVAVITSAIACSLNTTSDNLVVRSIRRVNSKWQLC